MGADKGTGADKATGVIFLTVGAIVATLRPNDELKNDSRTLILVDSRTLILVSPPFASWNRKPARTPGAVVRSHLFTEFGLDANPQIGGPRVFTNLDIGSTSGSSLVTLIPTML